MHYQIVVDSSANMVNDPSVISVPLKISTDKREFIDDSNLDINVMVDYLASYKGESKTSCPNVHDYLEAFGDNEIVFAIAISSKLSGSYNAGRLAVEQYNELHPERKAYIFDSLATGPSMQLLKDKLVESIEMNLSFEEIIERVEEYKNHIDILYSLESLKNLANNGRVSKIVASGAGLLGIRIIGGSDGGKIAPKFKVKGEKKTIAKMFEDMQTLGYHGGRVVIDTCLNENGGNELARLVKEKFSDADVKVGKCNGLCSFYAEKGGIIVSFEK